MVCSQTSVLGARRALIIRNMKFYMVVAILRIAFGLRRRDTVCVLGVQRGARDAANTLFDTKILLCQLYGLWGYSEGIGMAAIRSPGTCREVRADWGLITGNTLSACVRPERDAQWPCSGARSTPQPPVGLW